jgi:Helicase HerA, central domain
MVELIPGVGGGSHLDKLLLTPDRALEVGGIYRIDFERALVLTADKWKEDAGGIPQHCFLLATARDISGARPSDPDDDEVLLLRVERVANLTMERDLLAVREEALRDALVTGRDPTPSDILDLDPFTKERISFTGLECRILGTFYEDIRNGTVVLEWGHDVDNFYATATYRVYKPVGEGLSYVASYLKPLADEPVERVRLGVVRYSSTRRRAVAAGHADAAVEVNVHDFIGHKTGMFGMTRMGKSNTMKIVAARVFIVSERERAARRPPIGQLIFDPQGEYANPTVQDGTELAAIGPAHVSIYRYGPPDFSKPNLKPLGINFYDPEQIELVKYQVKAVLAGDTGDYVRAFALADFAGKPLATDTKQEAEQRRAHAERGRLFLYAALREAGFAVPHKDLKKSQYPYRVWVSMERDLADAVESTHPGSLKRSQWGSVGVEREALVKVATFLATDHDDKRIQKLVADWRNNDPCKSAQPILMQVSQGRAVSGYLKLKPLLDFHSPGAASDYLADIYSELVEGRIVVVDLHLGPTDVVAPLSEQLVGHLIAEQLAKFTAGKAVPRIQVMVEEAHNLFQADRYRQGTDVWVKLAKEASKLSIGLVYATQEVTGVAHQVLANTKNWVVAHLNNSKEVQELSKFYDFQAHAESIIKAEDKGYVRLKTMSSPYIVPVQIDRYGLDLVNEARAAAGEQPLQPKP